jgi:hypothetical protein
MTNEEAKKILSMMTKADGGCYHCAECLMLDFLKTFPDFRALAEIIYKRRFKKELGDDD